MDAIGGFQRYYVALPKAVNLILVALLGVALGRLFWALVPNPSAGATTVASAAVKPRAAGANHASDSLASITQAHLFGAQVAKTAQPLHAPETHLALTLTGILFSRAPHDSIAIISNAKHQQQFYKPGGKVEKGVALHAIYPDRIILKRAGRLETLKLDQGGLATAKNNPNSSNSSNSSNGAQSNGQKPNLAQLRQKLLQQPDSIDQYMRLQPVYQSGQLQGYRVYPNQNRAAFFATGLKPGDMVKAINGIPLNNPGKALSALNQLGQANKIEVSVTRLGHNRTLTVAFD